MLHSRQRNQVSQKAAATGPSGKVHDLHWQAFGALCRGVVVSDDDSRVAEFDRSVQTWLAGVEQIATRGPKDSVLTRINEAAGRAWVSVGPDVEPWLDLCGSLHFMTQGLVDSSDLPLRQLWMAGLDTGAASEVGGEGRGEGSAAISAPSSEAIAAARLLVGWSKIKRKPCEVFLPHKGMALGFDLWIQAYVVDGLIAQAQGAGFRAASVGCGEQFRAIGLPPGESAWNCQPEGALWSERVRGLQVVERGVAWIPSNPETEPSTGQRKTLLIDPRTGMLVSRNSAQVVVVASTALQARALAVSAAILGGSAGIRLLETSFAVEGCWIQSGTKHQTKGFSALLGVTD
ncbi:MAG TPA: FAD:protein FMN transferase [Opitutaceae bacterium]|nr:FAD:protein FMN transferase [Opitutaceae bacterium]